MWIVKIVSVDAAHDGEVLISTDDLGILLADLLLNPTVVLVSLTKGD